MKILIIFLAVNLSSSLAYGAADILFKVETIERVETTPREISNFKESYLVRLTPDERKKLCLAAKEFAALDGMMSSEISEESYRLDKYSITDLSGNSVDDVVVRCETIPKCYLRTGLVSSSGTEMKILLWKNMFLSPVYIFEVKSVRTKPKLSRQEAEGDKQSNLYRIWIHDRLDICVAAKSHIKHVTPILQKSELEEPRVFEFTYPETEWKNKEIKKESLLAIDCESFPPMYVYFGKSKRDIKVILVETEPTPIAESFIRMNLESMEN